MEPTQRRYAAFYLTLAETATVHLADPDCGPWFTRLGLELDNCRAALRWAETRGEIETSLRLATALTEYRWSHGYLSEATNRLTRALARADAVDATEDSRLRAARAWAHGSLGILRRSQGDCAGAQASATTSLQEFERRGEVGGQAQAIWLLGMATHLLGDDAAGRRLLEQSLALYRAQGYAPGIVRVLLQLTLIAINQADDATARQRIDEGLAVIDAVGYREQGALLRVAAEVALVHDDLATARTYLGRALTLASAMDGNWFLHRVLDCCAMLAAYIGQPERALQLAAAADRERERIGARPTDVTGSGRWFAPALQSLSDEERAQARARGQALTTAEAVALARATIETAETPAGARALARNRHAATPPA